MNSALTEAIEWLSANAYGTLQDSCTVGGGSICASYRLSMSSGQSFFVKTGARLPAKMFRTEAMGLRSIEETGAVLTPKQYHYTPGYLVLDYIEPGTPLNDSWVRLGTRLAALHDVTGSRFGFDCDNYCGTTPQINTWQVSGYDFFAEHRLLFQARLAFDRGLLEQAAVMNIEKLCNRLPDLIPGQPASLIHGDLWSGNMMFNANGDPILIDPATHWGWAEADLAMTRLFGGFNDEFYRAYEEARPTIKGWRKRVDLYNLYHLLNHLNLFGSGYLGQVLNILKRYL
jgi:fructosamine-3-kinase